MSEKNVCTKLVQVAALLTRHWRHMLDFVGYLVIVEEGAHFRTERTLFCRHMDMGERESENGSMVVATVPLLLRPFSLVVGLV